MYHVPSFIRDIHKNWISGIGCVISLLVNETALRSSFTRMNLVTSLGGLVVFLFVVSSVLVHLSYIGCCKPWP